MKNNEKKYFRVDDESGFYFVYEANSKEDAIRQYKEDFNLANDAEELGYLHISETTKSDYDRWQPNQVLGLVSNIGYEEFLIQLIMYEKALSREEATKIKDAFMEADGYCSIFEIQQLIENLDF